MGTVVWITGASSGIGRAVATKFSEAGVPVVVSSRSKSLLEKFESPGKGKIFAVPMDLTNSNSINEAFKEITDNFKIDGLINNAGITVFKSFAETSLEEIEKVIRTNLLGTLFVTRLVLSQMLERERGTIINNISVASEKIFENSAVYSATKAGLKIFSQALREEVRNKNIKVINIYPGATRTPIWSNEILNERGGEMMSADDVAQFFLDAYLNKSSAITEEIILRPIRGDI